MTDAADVPIHDRPPAQERGDLEDHAVPLDLLELHEVIEWQAAVDAEGGA